MLRARTRSLLLSGTVLGLLLTLAPRPSLLPVQTAPVVEEIAFRNESGTLPEYNPDPTLLPPGAISRIRNVAFRHPAPVGGLAISADSVTAYTVAGDSTFAWDLNTGRLRWEAKGVPAEKDVGHYHRDWPIAPAGSVVRVRLREGGNLPLVAELDAATGLIREIVPRPLPGQGVHRPDPNVSRYVWHSEHPSDYNGPRTAEVRDIADRAPPVALECSRWYAQFFSPDGRLIGGGWQEGVIAYSTETGKCVRSARVPPEIGPFHSHTFTADSTEVVGAGRGVLAAVNVRTGQWRVFARTNAEYVKEMRCDPTGRTLAVRNGFYWELWDFTTGQLRHVLDTHRYGDGQFTPDGKQFVTIYGDRLVAFDVASGVPIGAPVWPLQVRWTNDNRLLTLSGPSVAVWNPFTAQRIGTVPPPHDFARYLGYPYSTDLSPDGSRLAYPTIRHTVAVLDLKTGARAELPTDYGNTIEVCPRFFPTGRKLLVTTATGIRATDPDRGTDPLVLPEKLERELWDTTRDISPDGRFVTTRNGGLVDLQTKQPVPLLGRNRLNRQWMHFTPDGRHLIGTVMVYAENEEEDERIRQASLFKCNGPERETRLAVWEVPSGKQVGFYPLSLAGYTWPAMLSDSRSLAYIDSAANVVLVELATGKVRWRFRTDGWAEPCEYGTTATLDASHDGRYLASSIAGSVLVWDVRGERSRLTVPPNAEALERAWDALSRQDAVAAFVAIRVLAAFPNEALPFLRAKLTAANPPTVAQVRALIATLSDEDFPTREQASADLARIGTFAGPAMHDALARNESPEARQRLTKLLTLVRRATISENLRAVRMVESVEWMGTAQAAELLTVWAGNESNGRLADEAKTALARRRGVTGGAP